MTTIIAIGDVHIKTNNIPEVDLLIERLLKLINEKPPEIIVVLGDLLHTHERLHTTALNKAYELIEKLRSIAPTYVLVGNHDMTNNQQFLTQNHWLSAMKEWHNVTIVDKIENLKLNEHFFVFCPYVPNGRFEEALNTCEEDWKDASVIFAHQEFRGCKMGAIQSIDGDAWLNTYPNVISGHIHSRQQPQENIYYTGSAIQHAFGESKKNIIAILTFQGDKQYELEEIDLKLPRKRIIYTNVEDMETYEEPETNDKIKITISGQYDQFKAFKKTKRYKELIKKGTKVVFKPKKIESNKKHDPEVEKETDFKLILSTLINGEKNPYLCQVYELIINNKQISEDDVFFLS